MKTCSICKKEKEDNQFYRINKLGILISRKHCTTCKEKSAIIISKYSKNHRKERNEYQNKFRKTNAHLNYVAKNRERLIGISKAYYNKHKEQIIKEKSIWIKNNPEKHAVYTRNWWLRNKERKRELTNIRRHKIHNTQGSHTIEEWEYIKKICDYMCLCCKKYEPEIKLTEDHIIPIARGGSDDISNIQPLCRSCNSRKWAHTKIYPFPIIKSRDIIIK